VRSSESTGDLVLGTLLSTGWQSVKTGLLKPECFGIFTKLGYAASVLHGYGSVISHIRTENTWRFFFLWVEIFKIHASPGGVCSLPTLADSERHFCKSFADASFTGKCRQC